MTEAEWLAANYAGPMLSHLRGIASERKLRLFAVACCRRVGHLLTDERSRQAVEIAEQYAEGLVDRHRLVQARDEAREAKRQFRVPAQPAASRAANAAQDATRDTGRSAASNCLHESSRAVSIQDTNNCDPAELQEQASILRCIFGNPPHPIVVEPSWLRWNDGITVKLAENIYNGWSFDRLPRLADALEDAGCNKTSILNHLRGPGSHALGCWVLDAVLGKV
jgi:hypothetical protein